MARLELYPFRYRDPVTGKWVRAGHLAERHQIAGRYAEWEIAGQPEVRHADPNSASFNPYRVTADAEPKRLEEPAPPISPHLERPPVIEALECFLVAVFLRRYVTYCARRGRYEQMEGATRLHRQIVGG